MPKSPPEKLRLPMMPEVLAKVKAIQGKDPSKFDHVMLWVACCLCYFVFLRSGEITAIGVSLQQLHSSEHGGCIS